ncbi:hypothetical protein ASC64_17540 [Nocardioides sp. Root122]|nr:hypothetical protein ASC64_17540 [Nocardioides sp. Root122]
MVGVAVAFVAAAVCCGVPASVALGALVGISVQSWALAALGLVLGALGWARMGAHRGLSRPAAPGMDGLDSRKKECDR